MTLENLALINGIAVAAIVIAIALSGRLIKAARRKRQLFENLGSKPAIRLPVFVEIPYSRLQKLGDATIGLTPKSAQDVTNKQLVRAGLFGSGPRVTLFFSELSILGIGLISIFSQVDNPLQFVLNVFLVAGIATLPRTILTLMAQRRAQQVEHELPMLVDLMLLTVSGGLGLTTAIQKIVQNQSGVLVGELNRTLEDLSLGVKRVDAFSALARRTKSSELRRFADAIMKVDQLGVSLTTVLKAQANEMRHRRRISAREKAQRITVKILFPVIICFLPGLFIVVLGPAIIDIITTLGL